MARTASLRVLGRLALVVVGTAACGPERSPRDDADVAPPPPGGRANTLTLTAQSSGTAALLQAVSPVDSVVVWVSGHDGTWGRTLDGGSTWHTDVVPGADALEFRDVEAFDASRAVLMAAGPGDRSRIYRTIDAGASWDEVWVMPDSAGFLDCMAFLDSERGFAYGDAVAGALYLLGTVDGGSTWTRIPRDDLPPALEGEGGFAASGSCVAPAGDSAAVVATGAGPEPRLISTYDGGRTWSVAPLPLTAGPAAGATSVGVGADGFAWAVGGAIGDPIDGARVVVSADGGTTWMPAGEPGTEGALYGAARAPGFSPPALVAVGPGGLAWSGDGGMSWATSDTTSHWAVAFTRGGRGWAVGPSGRITALQLSSAPPSTAADTSRED